MCQLSASSLGVSGANTTVVYVHRKNHTRIYTLAQVMRCVLITLFVTLYMLVLAYQMPQDFFLLETFPSLQL
jgi:hypothetical protein